MRLDQPVWVRLIFDIVPFIYGACDIAAGGPEHDCAHIVVSPAAAEHEPLAGRAEGHNGFQVPDFVQMGGAFFDCTLDLAVCHYHACAGRILLNRAEYAEIFLIFHKSTSLLTIPVLHYNTILGIYQP